MHNQELTDKEIENLYKSINNFTDFFNKINFKNDIETNDFSIRFKDEIVSIKLSNENTFKQISEKRFERIVNELTQQKKSDENFSKIKNEKEIQFAYQNEIFKIDANIYKISNKFIETMYFESDFATGYPNYERKLSKLISIFDNPINKLMIEKTNIYNSNELFEYLKKYGFKVEK